MSGGATVEHIDAVDAFARTLFVRAKQSTCPAFGNAALAVRQLHLALRHLRIEAADVDSPLHGDDASLYARQLQPIVENCDFTLKQLNTVLDKYGFTSVPSSEAASLADNVAAVTARLTEQKANVDMFLDAIQLHNPLNQPKEVEINDTEALEATKSKVDVIAARLLSRRDSGLSDDPDRMWQEFKTELEKEGFSPQILQKHKDVLRAYIRELDSVYDGGAAPTVEGLLEYEANIAPQAVMPPIIPPKIPLKAGNANTENDKCQVDMKSERRLPDHAPATTTTALSSRFPEDTDGDSSTALISTRDLVTMDELNYNMRAMHLQPRTQQYGNSPNTANSQRYLMPNMSGALPVAEVNGSSQQGSSPRFQQYTPYSGYEDKLHKGSSPPRQMPRLAPDRYGKEIPLDAQWTRIRRTLVSPEVLERAGVRYEARPDYVAVLGRLSRDQIAAFAQQSADCRAARSGKRPRSMPQRQEQQQSHYRDRPDSRSSREDRDDGSVLWDSGDSTDLDDDKTSDKGTKSYPYIVPFPIPIKTSPSSTVKPKPILKNKNQNHVHFGPNPYEVDPRGSSPSRSSFKDDRRNYTTSGGISSSSSSRRRRDRRDSDYEEDRDDRYYRSNQNDRRTREDRAIRKKSLGETLGAVGIGGAAVSLLTVLAQAAVGM